MKLRPRWEVRSYAYTWLANQCGIQVGRQLLSARAYRWRWLAYLCAFPWMPMTFMGVITWTEVHRKVPVLRIVESKCPPAPSQPRGLGNGIGSGGAGRAPVLDPDALE